MYISKINNNIDRQSAIDFVKQHGFGTLFSMVDNQPFATHIPMYIDANDSALHLYGHIASANIQSSSFDGTQVLLATFMEHHAYVSSSWYHHVNVPTWNYEAVHLYGVANAIEGQIMIDSINKLVDKYEAGRPRRFHVDQMSERDKQAHYRGLIAFRMNVTEIQFSQKLSQNRKDIDYYNVTDHLSQGNETEKRTAEAMLKIRPKT